jgi:hypothetical protein
MLFVAVGSDFAVAKEMTGPGWRFLQWDIENQESAALVQFYRDNHIVFVDGQIDAPPLHCDPPESIPRWTRLWDLRNKWRNTAHAPILEHGHVMEIALGWPLPAFAIDSDQLPPCETRGGWLFPRSPTGGQRVLAWRPTPLGFALDTLLYAACLAGLAAGVRLLIRARRRRRGACAACGYSLAGLAGVAACPECGSESPGGDAGL